MTVSGRHPGIDWSFIIQLVIHDSGNSKISKGNLQNLLVAEGTIILKFPFVYRSAKEVAKLKEDKGCLVFTLTNTLLFLIVFQNVELDIF